MVGLGHRELLQQSLLHVVEGDEAQRLSVLLRYFLKHDSLELIECNFTIFEIEEVLLVALVEQTLELAR